MFVAECDELREMIIIAHSNWTAK